MSRSPSLASKDEEIPATNNSARLSSLSSGRKSFLLAVFCSAQFLDTFNNAALFAAIPPISAIIHVSNANSVWLLSAYQLTFAAFLLTSGRLTDIYNGNYVFVAGALVMGFSALGAGFVRTQIPLIVLRAIMGIGAALNVPSALQLIVGMYPDPTEQSKAVGIFVSVAGIGNVLGLFISAIFVTFATWPWVFYFIAIAAIITGFLGLLLIPKVPLPEEHKGNRIKRLDLPGVSVLTIAVILFVFAVTSGSIDGWGSATVIANLVISIVLTIAFFIWEAYIPEEVAALPPKVWRYENFGIIVATALLPYVWWGAVMALFSWLWQEVYGWTALITAVHFLPISLTGVPVIILSDVLQKKFPLKWVTLAGMIITVAGTVLLPFADAKDKYWRFAFPALLIGTAGVSMIFSTSNISVFKVTPPSIAGTVGAIFNCVLNLGCAAGLAIITSIQTSVQIHHGGPNGYQGRAAGFWFLFAFVVTLTLAVAVFMKNTIPPVKVDPNATTPEEEAAVLEIKEDPQEV